MIENFKVITVTHHTTNVSDIDQFVITNSSDAELAAKIESIKESHDIDEVVYLSTCNRVCYILFSDSEITDRFISSFFGRINSDLQDKDVDFFTNRVSIYEGIEAVRYMFEVSGSIDSLIVGEREIFRQVRAAFDFASQYQIIGEHLKILEKVIIQCSKKIYSTTRIGEKPLSIAALATELIGQSHLDTDMGVLLIGAGETNQLMAKFLTKKGFNKYSVYNRSLDNASSFANQLNGSAHLISDLGKENLQFNLIVVATSSTKSILTSEIYANILGSDSELKTIVDLSVPRNVDEELVKKYNINYISIDHLKHLSEKNLDFRKQEISIAKVIIKKHLPIFKALFSQRLLELALFEFPREIKLLKTKTLDEVFSSRISLVDEDAKNLIYEMMDYFEKKTISIPMKSVKRTLIGSKSTEFIE
jgi:glutamyl-tRNA reductase